MNRRSIGGACAVVVGLCAGGVQAQDSVSKLGCLPGDAVRPWDATGATHGSEQCNHYVVDLSEFQTSWGQTFGIAPIVKSSRTSSGFFGSLTSANGISRDQLTDVPFAADSYDLWTGPGFGVNGDPAINDPGIPLDTSSFTGNQFALGFAEFSTAAGGGEYNGIVGALVNYLPAAPRRLYVSRVLAASNSCSDASELSQFGFGSVDATGYLHFRADDFSLAGGCGLTSLLEDNLYQVNLAARMCGVRNVVSNDFLAGGQFDVPATRWLLRNATVSANTPGIVPASVTGGPPLLIGTNFMDQFLRGASFPLTMDNSHLATVVAVHRGNISYTARNCARLNSTHGIVGILGKAEAGGAGNETRSEHLNVFGINAGGSVTGKQGLRLPPTLTDPTTGRTFTATDVDDFAHRRSQVAFRGGNGQIALGADQQGNLLAAAVVDHPFVGLINITTWPINYVAVAKLNCAAGTVTWTLAGYTDDPAGDGGLGKPILNGPAGAMIGRMINAETAFSDGVFDKQVLGPSVSGPMIDSAGNVYFLSVVELFGEPESEFTTALLRAVYDPMAFAYRLELMFKLNDVFPGANSGRNYRIDFLSIRDSNSVDSGTAWSQNILETAHLGMSSAGLPPGDPRTLGGLVIAAEIIYDYDQDGDYQANCGVGNGDQDYNVMLYIGSVAAAGCEAASDCNDNTLCTLDLCDGGSCSQQAISYGDINNDGVLDEKDTDCVLDTFAGVAHSPHCGHGKGGLPPDAIDIAPCPATNDPTSFGNGEINADDVLAVLDGREAIFACCPTGACCVLGVCSQEYESACAFAGGNYQGDGTSCVTHECPAIGACCLAGICSDALEQDDCVAAGGVYQGDDTECAGVTCPRGACCTVGICANNLAEAVCEAGSGTYQGDGTTCAIVMCPAAPPIRLNEIRIDQPGTDNDEFFELRGTPGQSMNGFTYVVIGDGVGGSGVVEMVADLSGENIPADGYFLAARSTFSLPGGPADFLPPVFNFENSDRVTHLLVIGFTGSNNQDLDTNDDGTLDATPWSAVADCLAFIGGTGTDLVYCPTQVGPDGTFVPGLVYRCPDGTGPWQIGPFDPTSGFDSAGMANFCLDP